MRVRTFAGIVAALVVVVVASYLTQQNIELLGRPFALTAERSMPIYAVVLAAFLLGFLPVGTVLLVQTLKRDLAQRRERRLSREADSFRGSFRRALDYQADGQWPRAAAELEALLADQPEEFATLLGYGEVLRHRGRVQEALEVHRRASVLYPHSVAVLYQLAEDYEAMGEPGVAEQIRDRVLRDYPGLGLQILRRRRNAAIGAGEWREAIQLQERLESVLRDNGDEAELEREFGVRRGLDYQEGVALLEAQRTEEARAVFRRLLDAEPRFLPAALMLGEAAALDGDDEVALVEWRGGYESTGSPVFLQRIEDHFIESERPIEAIETLHELIAESTNDLLPRFFLGRLYYRLEMHPEALKALAGLGERIHSSPTYHFLLARIHERRGELRRAAEAYLACVQEAGITAAEYVCSICRAKYASWHDRCGACGSWNSVELDFEEERVSAEELGVRPRPVWAVYGERGMVRSD